MTVTSTVETRARWAVAAIFALHGVAAGSWAGRIPWVKETRHLSAADLGLALMGAAIGGLAVTPAAAWLIARLGSRTLTRAGVLGVAAALPLVPFMPGLPTVFVALFLFGATGGVLDVAMNAHGVEIQHRYGRSIMSGLHGMWSLGGLAGAALAGLAARAEIGAPAHLTAVGVTMAVLATLAGRRLLPTEPPAAPQPVFARPDRGLVLLGVITFCGLFSEAAASDWSAVYLRTEAGAAPDVAAWGYAGFALAMATGRMLGDRLVTRAGPARLVRVTALTGAAGLAVGLLVPVTLVAVLAFVVLGIGVAAVVPLTFSAAGRVPGRDPGASVAAVATVGYGGWLAAPPLVGFVAEATSLTTALAVVAAMTALLALPAGALGRGVEPPPRDPIRD